MLFVVDLDSLELISAATDRSPVVSVQGKRGDETPFEVIFVRSGVAEELPTSTVLTFGAKPAGKYDDAAVVLSSDFTLSGTGTAAKYLGSPSFNTAELNALFLIDEDETNDPAYIDLMAEFTWQIGSGAPTSTKTFAFRVHNDVVRDAELDPTPLPTATAASTYAPLTILQIEVTGSLTSDGSQMVGPAAPLVYTGDGPDGGDRYYCTALGVVAELKWSDGSAQWIFSISDPTAGDSQWTAAGTLETPISDLSWFPTAPATGTPVMNFVGPVFPNAKPSNASVNTAISASPSTTRTALGLGALSTVTPGANVATALAIAADATGGMFRQGQALSASTVTASGKVSVVGLAVGGTATTPGTNNIEGNGYINLNLSGTNKFGVGGSVNTSYQDLYPGGVTNSKDLGSTANKWRTGYFGTSVETGNLTAIGTVKTGSYTKAAAIASSHATAIAAGDGAQSYISDDDKPVWSNGTVWKLADGTTLA